MLPRLVCFLSRDGNTLSASVLCTPELKAHQAPLRAGLREKAFQVVLEICGTTANAYLLFVGTARSREQKVVEIEGGVAAITGFAEGVRAIGVGGHRAVGAAQIWRHHLLGRRKRWTANK